MILYDEKGQEVNIVNYTKATNQDVPYESVWSIREEVNGNFKTQWATNQKGTDGYKRTFNGSTWADWLLVEGECELWKGTLTKGQIITIPRLKQFKRYVVYVSNVGYVELDGKTAYQYSGVSAVNSGSDEVLNIAVCYVDLTKNIFQNVACYGRPLVSIQAKPSTYQNITQIIGIP